MGEGFFLDLMVTGVELIGTKCFALRKHGSHSTECKLMVSEVVISEESSKLYITVQDHLENILKLLLDTNQEVHHPPLPISHVQLNLKEASLLSSVKAI